MNTADLGERLRSDIWIYIFVCINSQSLEVA